MLRKLMWSGLYAGVAALAAIAARAVSTRIWRIATGEQPPDKR